MAKPTDRVRAFKREDPAHGGSPSDARPWPKVLDPQQDALDAAGVYLQEAGTDDEKVGLYRDGGSLILFDDEAGEVDLISLAGGGGPPLSDIAPPAVTASSGTAGTAAEAARRDHRHQVSVGTPVTIGTANNAGTSTALARADHVHAHGSQPGGTLHALATPSNHGFLSATDKAKLEHLGPMARTLFTFSPCAEFDDYGGWEWELRNLRNAGGASTSYRFLTHTVGLALVRFAAYIPWASVTEDDLEMVLQYSEDPNAGWKDLASIPLGNLVDSEVHLVSDWVDLKEPPADVWWRVVLNTKKFAGGIVEIGSITAEGRYSLPPPPKP